MYSDLRFPYLIHSCKVTIKFKPSVGYHGALAALRTPVQMQAPSLPLQSRGLEVTGAMEPPRSGYGAWWRGRVGGSLCYSRAPSELRCDS